jgi:hypothetical protein
MVNATVKYVFNNTGTSFQLRYNHDATTSLDASSKLPMMKMGTTADAKMAIKPITE